MLISKAFLEIYGVYFPHHLAKLFGNWLHWLNKNHEKGKNFETAAGEPPEIDNTNPEPLANRRNIDDDWRIHFNAFVNL